MDITLNYIKNVLKFASIELFANDLANKESFFQTIKPHSLIENIHL